MRIEKISLKLWVSLIGVVLISSSLGTAVVLNKTSDQRTKPKKGESFGFQDPLISEIIYQINESTIRHYVQMIQGFGPHPTESNALNHLKGFLFNEFLSTGLSVHLESWRYQRHYGENIEATLKGTGSANDVVIVSAHYDSISISPGGDDDGSGVASVLAIAKVLSQYQFNCTIKFVLFSGEEEGLLGSHEYAQEAKNHNEHIIGDLNLDGVGHASSTPYKEKIWNFADDNAAWIVNINRELADRYPNLINLEVASRPSQPISDHQSFIDNGYVADCYLEGTIDPFYHTSDDTIDHMNITYLTHVCRLAAGTAATIARLNRVLTDKDIGIKIQGTLLSYPSLFHLRITNKKFKVNSANLTIHVEIKNLRTGEYLKTVYNASSNWTISTEVKKSWDFIVGLQRYPTQRISFSVTIEGFSDDVGLYKKTVTSGIILPYLLIIVPRSS